MLHKQNSSIKKNSWWYAYNKNNATTKIKFEFNFHRNQVMLQAQHWMNDCFSNVYRKDVTYSIDNETIM